MNFATDDDAPLAIDLRPDWPALVGWRTLELEIGSGHGGFALAFARSRPGAALVAIEQRKAFASAIASKAVRRGLPNLVVIHGDARVLAPRLFGPGSLAAVHVHFPDPWWKRRHHRRRIVDEGTSTLLLRLLAPGGLLDLRTDVERYALDAVARLEAAGFENEAGPGGFSALREDDIPSTREKRYLATGQRIWRLRLRRPAAERPGERTVEGERSSPWFAGGKGQGEGAARTTADAPGASRRRSSARSP